MDSFRVFLRCGDTGELMEASLLDEVTDSHLSMWDTTWIPAMQSHCAGRAPGDKPEDHHWDWRWKGMQWRTLLGYHSFALLCRNELQGLLIAADLNSARIEAQFGKPIVYAEFLATAPWNRPEVQRPPRYRGVGTVMIGAAIELSFDLGY